MISAVTGSPITATTNLTFNAQEGGNYELSYQNELESILFIATDKRSGERIGERRAKKEKQNIATTLSIPIFVPIR